VIVESPTKAKTLAKFLGGDYKIEATYGHIRDLPKSKLGIDVEKDFQVIYSETDKQKKRIAEIRKLAKSAKKIFLATDPDREGEAIAWHVAEVLKAKPGRITFHEITKTAITKALEEPRDLDLKLVDAQVARRVLDRLVGYKLSPLLWKKIRTGLSAGRVQSVAVRLIVDKEREIEAFKPQEYWEVEAELKNKDKKRVLAQVAAKDGKKFGISNGEQASRVVEELETSEYVVEKVEDKEFKRTPPPPFTTSTLQQVAANRLGWSAKKTMQAAQGLYEEGFITYHRTDSTNVAEEAVVRCRDYVQATYGTEYVAAVVRVYKTKSKVAQEAHEAIRPTLVDRINSEDLPTENEGKRLYELIWKRFVATQMADTSGKTTVVTVQAGSYQLEARGERVVFDGWGKLYANKAREDGVEDHGLIPQLEVGEKLQLIQLIKQQKFTQPPARYNDASLIKELEELGIGRPSTYAPTLATILERRYVEKEEKRYKPTVLGGPVNDFLVKYFPEIVDYKFTANMEDELDKIANGESDWKKVIGSFYQPFENDLIETEKSAERVKIVAETTGEKCPKCGEGDQVIRMGKFGKFLACARFPDCDWKGKFELKTGILCPKCGGDVVTKKSKRGRTFYGCSNYPKCDYASWDLPKM
jgi:DNA topoisomerase-1